VQRTSGYREAEQQAAWSILIIRIIFDDGGIPAGFPDFLFADISFHNPSKSVAAELKLSQG
jgi:hypothetical protein